MLHRPVESAVCNSSLQLSKLPFRFSGALRSCKLGVQRTSGQIAGQRLVFAEAVTGVSKLNGCDQPEAGSHVALMIGSCWSNAAGHKQQTGQGVSSLGSCAPGLIRIRSLTKRGVSPVGRTFCQIKSEPLRFRDSAFPALGCSPHCANVHSASRSS